MDKRIVLIIALLLALLIASGCTQVQNEESKKPDLNDYSSSSTTTRVFVRPMDNNSEENAANISFD